MVVGARPPPTHGLRPRTCTPRRAKLLYYNFASTRLIHRNALDHAAYGHALLASSSSVASSASVAAGSQRQHRRSPPVCSCPWRYHVAPRAASTLIGRPPQRLPKAEHCFPSRLSRRTSALAYSTEGHVARCDDTSPTHTPHLFHTVHVTPGEGPLINAH